MYGLFGVVDDGEINQRRDYNNCWWTVTVVATGKRGGSCPRDAKWKRFGGCPIQDKEECVRDVDCKHGYDDRTACCNKLCVVPKGK